MRNVRSKDIIKQGDFFVCRCCGLKYTPESTRQLFIQSIVKIDNSDRVRNLFNLARRAFKTGDYANCAAHYNELKFECPNNWEVLFYGDFCSAADLPYRGISSGIDRLERIMIAVYELVCQTNDKQTSERIMYDIQRQKRVCI